MTTSANYMDKYTLGLKTLTDLLRKKQINDEVRAELAVLESRLIENIEEERLYGPSEQTRSTRARIVHDLNRFALEYLDKTFIESAISESSIDTLLKIPFRHRTYSNFVGRDNELATLRSWLDSENVRVIVISGIGGIGKSSLALEAAIRNAFRFTFGVVWTSARELSDFNLETMSLALLSELGISASFPESPSIILRSYVRRYSTLLLLDNLERVAPDELQRIADFVHNALPESGESKIIITTRIPIQDLDGWYFTRSLNINTGLDFDSAIDLATHTLQSYEMLFERQVIAQIVSRVGGHPKLLEIIIGIARRRGWARALEITSTLGSDFDYTLESLLDSSIQFLSNIGREVLFNLPVLPTSMFTIAEVKAITSSPIDVELGIDQLVDSGLANFDLESGTYTIHQLVSDYANRYTTECSDPFMQARIRLATYYLQLLQTTDFVTTSTNRKILQNIIGTVEWCSMNKLDALTIDLTLALVKALETEGMYVQGIKLLNSAVKFAEPSQNTTAHLNLPFNLAKFYFQIGDFSAAVPVLQRYLDATKDQLTTSRVDAMHYLAIIHSYPRWKRYSGIDATVLLRECVKLRYKLTETLKMVHALSDLSRETFARGNVRLAGIWMETALSIASRQTIINAEDRRVFGIILRCAGHHFRDLEQLEKAREFLEKSKVALEQSHTPGELGHTLYSCAEVLVSLGDLDMAEQLLRRDIAILEKYGNISHLTYVWSMIGKIDTLRGNFEDAERAYRKSMEIWPSLGEENSEDYINYYGLGRLESRRGNYPIAITYLTQSLEMREQVGHHEGIPFVLMELSYALANIGKLEEAIRELEEAISLAKRIRNPRIRTFLKKAQELREQINKSTSNGIAI